MFLSCPELSLHVSYLFLHILQSISRTLNGIVLVAEVCYQQIQLLQIILRVL